MTVGIYRIKNKKNNKCYIGSSKNIEKRFHSHKSMFKKNKHHNLYMQNVYNKYGKDIFVYEIVEIIDDYTIEKLHNLEQIYIDYNYNGYNLGSVGGGDNLTNHPNKEEIIEKIRQASINTVNSLTPQERKEKWGQPGNTNGNWKNGGITRKICPICGVNNISYNSKSCSSCLDRTGENNPFYGRRHTEEYKEKSRQRILGRKHTKEAIEKFTGEKSGKFMGYYHTPWGIFPSSSQAQKAHKYMLSATIHRWCLECNKKIVKQAASKSKFLKENGGHDLIGKSYRDLGFWFEPK